MSWEYLGYIASALLVASLTMTDVVKLRWYNMFGCVVFTAYGVAIDAVPVIFTNALLSLVNLYHIIKIYRQPKVEVSKS